MKLLVVAVGQRMPGWAQEAWTDFSRRMPREMPVELVEVKAEWRSAGKSPAVLMAAEAVRLRAAMPARCRKVVLDERGSDVTTQALARRMEKWLAGGEDVAFLVGGPDGLDPSLKQEADETLRLSSLTLPHALARVLLVEALYRASSVLRGHPYHRE